jgi:hypothetical protein
VQAQENWWNARDRSLAELEKDVFCQGARADDRPSDPRRLTGWLEIDSPLFVAEVFDHAAWP